VAFLVLLCAPALLVGQEKTLDEYKIRISGFWLHSTPTVTLEAAGHNGFVNFNRDFGFNDYSTFIGKFDWKFTRKNHLYFVGIPFIQSRQVVLNRTITFRGQTFQVGALTRGELESIVYAPGYQYDIIRRRRGHLGFAVQFNFFDTTGTLSAGAQVTSGGVHQAATVSRASLQAPIPVAGPDYRLYLTKSPRLFVEGNINGMYFFGYGNYFSTANNLGLSLSKHFSVNAGYAIGSRLRVNDGKNRAGLGLTQKGPIVGVQVSL
jgi:hypothetical protein